MDFLKYFPLVKVDEASHMVWGIVTSEAPDSQDEICDYDAAKAAIKSWSDETLAKTTSAGQDPSLGNMRVMHQLQVGGKAIKIEYRDDTKQVWVGSEPANEEVWHLLKGGFLTAHSIGGNYLWKKKEGEHTRYAPTINEISYVDRGANPEASFAYVKADGTTELRKFVEPGKAEQEIILKLKKAQISSLSESDVQRIAKAVGDSILGTHGQKIDEAVAEAVRQQNAARTTEMTAEQIKKCAAALGISEDEFKKKFVEGDGFEKAAKGMAALHGHMQKAMAHHDAMMDHHEKMGKMHAEHSAHLSKCMKCMKDVMGSDDKESEKALKALLDELAPNSEMVSIGKTADGVEIFRKKDSAEVKLADLQKGDSMKTEEVSALIKAALEEQSKDFDKKLEKSIAPNNGGTGGARLSLVDRDGKVISKADSANAMDPLAVD